MCHHFPHPRAVPRIACVRRVSLKPTRPDGGVWAAQCGTCSAQPHAPLSRPVVCWSWPPRHQPILVIPSRPGLAQSPLPRPWLARPRLGHNLALRREAPLQPPKRRRLPPRSRRRWWHPAPWQIRGRCQTHRRPPSSKLGNGSEYSSSSPRRQLSGRTDCARSLRMSRRAWTNTQVRFPASVSSWHRNSERCNPSPVSCMSTVASPEQQCRSPWTIRSAFSRIWID